MGIRINPLVLRLISAEDPVIVPPGDVYVESLVLPAIHAATPEMVLPDPPLEDTTEIVILATLEEEIVMEIAL